MISRPIVPNHESLEYLPTQVISEYLATKDGLSLDGIIFASSQTGGNGANIVLFNHASIAELDDIPLGTKFDFWTNSGPEDDPDPTIHIFERRPSPKKLNSKKKDLRNDYLSLVDERNQNWLSKHSPTLRLEKDSIQVLEIAAVNYQYSTRDVMRSIGDSKSKATKTKF